MKTMKAVLLLALLTSIIVTFRASTRRSAGSRVVALTTGGMTASSELLNVREAIEHYRTKIRRRPDAAENYVGLSQLLMQRSRLTQNHHQNISEIQSLLNEAFDLDPNSVEAMVNQASLFLTLHKFEAAKTWAEKALRVNEFNAYAWGVLSDALKELGDYDHAVEACDRMLAIRPDIRSYARASHLREIFGDNSGAKQAMRMAADAGIPGLESRAWALYHLGNLYLNEGSLDTAKYIYEGILTERPKYAYALSGLAFVASAKGEHEAAIQSFLQAYSITAEHAFMEELVRAYRLSGNSETADVLVASVQNAYLEHETQGWNVNLEYARFLLEEEIDFPDALRRAQAEYERRPGHIDVVSLYVRVLNIHGRFEEGEAIVGDAMARYPDNSTLNFCAGTVAYYRRNYHSAKHYLTKSVALDSPLSEQDHKTAWEMLERMDEIANVGRLAHYR